MSSMTPFKAPAASYAGDASPSITVEKGTYRMRAPYTKALAKSSLPVARTRRTGRRGSSNLAMLIAVLAIASMTSFGLAYYLLATRWDDSELSQHQMSNQHSQGVPIDFLRSDQGHATDENFLAYLPHSGFHNQRIALENALVLARLLNRTLLVPPIYIGTTPIRYVPFNALYRDLSLADKTGLYHCSHAAAYTALPLECMDFFTHTQLSWNWLLDLRIVEKSQKLRQRWNMTEAWISDRLNIMTKDVLFIKDELPYQYRFFDTEVGAHQVESKFSKSVSIEVLKASTKRLIHIGTLFGSSRLHLKGAANFSVRGTIRGSMNFANPSLLKAANSIVELLGSSYLGVHLRLGDGDFKKNSRSNTRLVWWKVVHHILQYNASETVLLEHLFVGRSQEPPPVLPSDRSLNPRIWYHAMSSSHCRASTYTAKHLEKLNVPIFISTDLDKDSPLLLRFRNTFPCIFFLSDFPTAMSILEDLNNPKDNVKLKEFIVPFLDALVISHAWEVVGTENSTFSRFVQDVLWRKYRGLPILQRG